MYRQDIGRVVDACDRRDVADEIEIELVVERRVDRVRRTHHEQRISVCRRAHDRLGGDIAAATRPVLDGKRLLNVSPRIGHLHVHIDDLTWGWVEATSDNNTISVAGLPPGQHKMLVELVDANHHVFAGCVECRQTVTFTVPAQSGHCLSK